MGLGGVKLSLLLKDLRPALVLPQPGGERGGERERERDRQREREDRELWSERRGREVHTHLGSMFVIAMKDFINRTPVLL